MILRQGEAIVLRTWPFLEADLVVSLFTREQGRIKGVARHAMRSRRRFGGALEPMTYVRASYAERPRQELVRLDGFEILSSPLSCPVDYARMSALQLLAEVLEAALPEHAPEDDVFRLVLAVLKHLQAGCIELPTLYFALWMNRLMGWMPELNHCVLCGVELRGGQMWYSLNADGMSCHDDIRAGGIALSSDCARLAEGIFRSSLDAVSEQDISVRTIADLNRFAFHLLERHLERRLASARILGRL